MDAGSPQSAVLVFGAFELHIRSGELLKEGRHIRLQPQPFRVLSLLASRAGQLVTREEIRQTIWGNETFVDFEQGLNFCINQIRAALGDDPETPRYIETLPRRGYRFLAPVEELRPAASRQAESSSRFGKHLAAGGRLWVAAVALAVILLSSAYLARQRFWRASHPASGKTMLAVLPFENLTGDTEQEYFSDGLTEEMITQLGRMHPERLAVIARTSAMQYKRTNKGTQQIGRELGVDYILEGSVRRAGDHVRISAQLIQVRDQTHLWAESYERDLRDILALQADVARAITQQIQLKLTPQAEARLGSAHPVNPEAYELYLKGRYLWNKRTEQGYKKAIEYFEQALEKEPQYAAAYSGLADCYFLLGAYSGLPFRSAMPKAKAAALKALELEPELAEAHTSLGFIQAFHDWKYEDAEREFKRAIEINPNYPTAHHWYGIFLFRMGRMDEAVAESQRALELDPLSLIINTDLALTYYFARQHDRAIEQSRKTLDMDPNFALALYTLGMAYGEKAMYRDAIEALQKAATLAGDNPVILGELGRIYAASGNKAEATRILRELQMTSRRHYVAPETIAVVYAELGEKGQAIHWLEKAYAERSTFMVSLKTEPSLDSLRSDPRFQDLLRRVGLPQEEMRK